MPSTGERRAGRRAQLEYRTGDDDLRWLAMRIAMLGVDFEVLEPAELVEQMRTLATRLTRAVHDHAVSDSAS